MYQVLIKSGLLWHLLLMSLWDDCQRSTNKYVRAYQYGWFSCQLRPMWEPWIHVSNSCQESGQGESLAGNQANINVLLQEYYHLWSQLSELIESFLNIQWQYIRIKCWFIVLIDMTILKINITLYNCVLS